MLDTYICSYTIGNDSLYTFYMLYTYKCTHCIPYLPVYISIIENRQLSAVICSISFISNKYHFISTRELCSANIELTSSLKIKTMIQTNRFIFLQIAVIISKYFKPSPKPPSQRLTYIFRHRE